MFKLPRFDGTISSLLLPPPLSWSIYAPETLPPDVRRRVWGPPTRTVNATGYPAHLPSSSTSTVTVTVTENAVRPLDHIEMTPWLLVFLILAIFFFSLFAACFVFSRRGQIKNAMEEKDKSQPPSAAEPSESTVTEHHSGHHELQDKTSETSLDPEGRVANAIEEENLSQPLSSAKSPETPVAEHCPNPKNPQMHESSVQPVQQSLEIPSQQPIPPHLSDVVAPKVVQQTEKDNEAAGDVRTEAVEDVTTKAVGDITAEAGGHDKMEAVEDDKTEAVQGGNDGHEGKRKRHRNRHNKAWYERQEKHFKETGVTPPWARTPASEAADTISSSSQQPNASV